MRRLHPSVVLLGFTIDDRKLSEIAQQSAVLPTQTHRFAWNLVNSLRLGGHEVRLLSVLPVPNYPEYPFKIIRASTIEQNNVRGISLGFINLLILKHLTRFLACIVSGTRFLRVRKPEVIIVHGVHTPFLIFARLMKYFLGIKICIVMTDPPGVVRKVDGPLSKMLKRIDRRLVKLLGRGFDGIICLTPSLAVDFAPSVPALILEGFANMELSNIAAPAAPEIRPFHVAYAGAISVEYGLENLVLGFRAISDPTARLNLYGKGPLDEWVLEQCELDKRICHHGVVSHDDLMPKLKEASVLVNPRPAAQDFVRYSFPSKILEYMALGVPVVTTRLASLPKEYLHYVQLTDDDTVSALTAAMEIVRKRYPQAAELASQGQAYVLRNKSLAAQSTRISGFLADIIATPDK